MNISVKSEYALKAVFDLAAQYLGAVANSSAMPPVKIADIAKRQKIPQKFLELILSGLKQAGFVESRRGAEGGYLLAKPADQITVGEVIASVEGRRKRADKAGPFSDMWDAVDECVDRVVDRTTFAELARSWRDRQTEYVPNWEI